MPKRVVRVVAWVVVLIGAIGIAFEGSQAQDIRPAPPVVEPVEPDERPRDRAPGEEGPELVPLPEAPSRAAAASRDRVRVTAVLPASWSGVAEQYQPYWTGIAPANAFGLQRWGSYFATSGIVPGLAPHPFFGPWGMLAYEGWLFERYRAVWGTPRAPDLLGDAALWLQRGDYAIASGRLAEAAHAYRRVTQTAPELPLGYFALGAALAALGEDEDAALAFRQALDRYPAWLALPLDWSLLYADPGELSAIQSAAARRAQGGSASSRFVAGVLHLFGDRAALGREYLSSLPGDRYAELLAGRGPR